jgi:hypothetical protein
MFDVTVRILSSSLIISRPVSLRLKLSPTIAFMSHLSSSVKVEKLKEAQ